MSTSTAHGKPFEPGGKFLLGTLGRDHLRAGAGDDQLEGLDGNDQLHGLAGRDLMLGGLGNDHLFGGLGNDILVGQPLAEAGRLRGEVNVMLGGAGDDVYYVNGTGDRVIEKGGEGVDTVYTSVGFTLPNHVENLEAYAFGLLDLQPLVGNALDNHIVGSIFDYDTIRGLDGNDTLDGGARQGGFLDGGNGDDVLIQPFGECLGAAGADLFVAGGRGAMTSPEAPIQVLDFNPAEGDRLHIVHPTNLGASELFESGNLRFDAEGDRLILDLDVSTSSADQVFVLPGLAQFDAEWVTVGVLW